MLLFGKMYFIPILSVAYWMMMEHKYEVSQKVFPRDGKLRTHKQVHTVETPYAFTQF